MGAGEAREEQRAPRGEREEEKGREKTEGYKKGRAGEERRKKYELPKEGGVKDRRAQIRGKKEKDEEKDKNKGERRLFIKGHREWLTYRPQTAGSKEKTMRMRWIRKKRRGVQGELSGFKDYSERVGVKVLPAALSPFSRPEPAATGSGAQFFTSGPNGSVTDSDNCSGLG